MVVAFFKGKLLGLSGLGKNVLRFVEALRLRISRDPMAVGKGCNESVLSFLAALGSSK